MEAHKELAEYKQSIALYARHRFANAIITQIGRARNSVEAIKPKSPLVIAMIDPALKEIYESAPPYSIVPHANFITYNLHGALGRQDTRHIKVPRPLDSPNFASSS